MRCHARGSAVGTFQRNANAVVRKAHTARRMANLTRACRPRHAQGPAASQPIIGGEPTEVDMRVFHRHPGASAVASPPMDDGLQVEEEAEEDKAAPPPMPVLGGPARGESTDGADEHAEATARAHCVFRAQQSPGTASTAAPGRTRHAGARQQV